VNEDWSNRRIGWLFFAQFRGISQKAEKSASRAAAGPPLHSARRQFQGIGQKSVVELLHTKLQITKPKTQANPNSEMAKHPGRSVHSACLEIL
jgi:hypothetical protein